MRHFWLKEFWKNQLKIKGFNTETEKTLRKNDSKNSMRVDVYAENDQEIIIVEIINSSISDKDPLDYLITNKRIRQIIVPINYVRLPKKIMKSHQNHPSYSFRFGSKIKRKESRSFTFGNR